MAGLLSIKAVPLTGSLAGQQMDQDWHMAPLMLLAMPGEDQPCTRGFRQEF